MIFRLFLWQQFDICDLQTNIELPWSICRWFALHCTAQVLVSRNIQVSGLWVVACRRPIFAAPDRRTKLGTFVDSRHTSGIVGRPSSLGIKLSEHILFDKRFSVNVGDLVSAAFEQP